MEAYEAVLSRRSIRKFHSDRVSEEIVDKLLAAGMNAPSAGNQQPWHFIVIDDREILNKIPEFHQYSQMLKHAPLAICVCGDLAKQIHEGYWIQDCSAATENILIAAHALGLGAVWLGIHPRKKRIEGLKELLNIPDSVEPLSLISLGQPDEEKPPAERYLQERIHRNGW